MSENKILRKGEYVNSASILPVAPKQYIIYDDNGEKQLFLRFENSRNERLTSICFNLIQYNAKGRTVKEEKIEFEVDVATSCIFAPEKQFALLNECADFRIDMVNVAYGAYLYEVSGNEVKSSYRKAGEKTVPCFDRTDVYSSMREKRHTVQIRTLTSFKILIPLFVIVLVAITAFGVFRASEYYRDKNTFTLDGMVYRFSDATKQSVKIVRYRGNEENLTISSDIEGYKIVSIEKNAFQKSNVKNVTVDGDIVLEKAAFANSRLETVELNAVKEISDSAFQNCKNLVQVNLGDDVTKIGASAFEGCTALRSIEISGVLQQVGAKAFANCKLISAIDLPAGLAEIGDAAFENCEALTELKIPDGVTAIGTYLVSGCSSLVEVTLPYIGRTPDEALPLCEILGYSISRASLERVTVTTATVIAPLAFSEEASLVEIEYLNDIEKIGDSAFFNCAALKSFTVGESVTEIGVSVFEGCTGLESIVYIPSVKFIPDGTFKNCTALVDFDFPANVEKIGVEAFCGCESLKSIDMPKSVKLIAKAAFKDCKSIASLTLPMNLDEISESMLENCTSLVSVEMSDGLLFIRASAFKGCESLEKLIIPGSVKTLAKGFAEGCTSLEELCVPYVGVGYGAAYLGQIFEPDMGEWDAEASNRENVPETLSSVTVLGGNITSHAFASCSSLKAVYIKGATTHMIGAEAFHNCSSLRKVELPYGLSSISDGAFLGCVKLNMIINKTDTLLSDYSTSDVYDTTNLTDHMLSLVTKEEDIKSVTAEGILMLYSEIHHEWYAIDVDTDDLDGVISFPATFVYNKNTVNRYKISDHFVNEKLKPTIEKICISPAVKEIGQYAFKDSKNLKNVLYEDASNLLYIKVGAFENCESLRVITIPMSVIGIEENAFYGCVNSLVVYNNSSLAISVGSTLNGHAGYYAELVLAEGGGESYEYIVSGMRFVNTGELWFLVGKEDETTVITELDFASLRHEGSKLNKIYVMAEVFRNDTNLRSVNISANVVKINPYAFSNCTALESISMTSGVESIGTYAFENCTALVSVELPNTITVVSEGCFYGCTSLSSIRLSTTTETIEQNAFYGCNSLRLVVIPASVQSIEWNAFAGCEQIYEVVNLSSYISIVVEDNANGCIAENALRVYTFQPSGYLTYKEVVEEGVNMLFAYSATEAYLCRMSYDSGRYYSMLSLPIFDVDGVVRDYKLHKTAFNNISIGSYHSIFIPSSVIQIHANAASVLNNCSPLTIYYDGNETQFMNTFEHIDSSHYIYYYSECIHDGGPYWRYDESNYITTAFSPTVFIRTLEPTCNDMGSDTETCTKCGFTAYHDVPPLGHSLDSGVSVVEPTCTTEGTMRYSCTREGCGYTEDHPLNALGHLYGEGEVLLAPTCTSTGIAKYTCTRDDCSYSYQDTIPTSPHNVSGDVCADCGALVKCNVTKDNFATLSEFTNDSAYAFTISDDGVITSTNTVNDTASTLIFTATQDCTLSFQYSVSSESTYDFFAIKKNGGRRDEISGTSHSYQYMEISLSAGDTVSFTYSKDGSLSEGSDCAYLKDLTIHYN